MSERKFLFEYSYQGHVYGIDMVASSEFEAKERLNAMGLARYCGEIQATVRVPGAAPLLRAWEWLTSKR